MTSDLDDDDLEDEHLPDGYIRASPLSGTRVRDALVTMADPADIDEVLPRDVVRESDDIERSLAEARARRISPPHAATERFQREAAATADHLMGFATVAGQLYVEVTGTRRGWIDYPETAALDLLQSAETTLGALGVLLRHGYVLDAEARWRGLHELACTSAVLADDGDVSAICQRYLAHGERLLLDDPAYDQAWAKRSGFFRADYEWLRESHPNLSRKGEPRRFSQRWLFDNAMLTVAPFDDWLRPSHAPVHMSSRAVAAGSHQADAAPAGYSVESSDQVAWQAACTFLELVGHVLRLPADEGMALGRRLAWFDTVRRQVESARPGPVREPDMTPAEQLGLL